MRYTPRDLRVIDADFRVIRPPFRGLSPRADRLIGSALGIAGMVCAVAGVYYGMLAAAMAVAVALASVAALLTTTHRHFAPIGFALALVLGLSGCAPAPQSADTMEATDQPTPEDVQASIREATRYRDPREGWTPKPMAMPGSAEAAEPAKEVEHEPR